MTVHIVPVGLSLTEFFVGATNFAGGVDDRLKSVIEEIEDQWHENRLGLDFDQEALERRLLDAFGLHAGEESKELRGFQEISTKLGAARWAHVPGVSAELDTVRKVASCPVPLSDLVILLASDTHDGRAAAIWNAIAMAGGDAQRVRYLPEIVPEDVPDRSPTKLVRPSEGQVLVISARGLDAGRSDGFRTPMKTMGMLGRLLVAGDRDQGTEPLRTSQEEIHLHLSGGYRATMPYLIALAEWLRTCKVETKAWVLHKDSPEPSELPSRLLQKEWVRCELKDFGPTATETNKRPPTNILLGYAYEHAGGMFRLTPFGEGMRVMFRDWIAEERRLP